VVAPWGASDMNPTALVVADDDSLCLLG
jgi:hypothetical protein